MNVSQTPQCFSALGFPRSSIGNEYHMICILLFERSTDLWIRTPCADAFKSGCGFNNFFFPRTELSSEEGRGRRPASISLTNGPMGFGLRWINRGSYLGSHWIFVHGVIQWWKTNIFFIKNVQVNIEQDWFDNKIAGLLNSGSSLLLSKLVKGSGWVSLRSFPPNLWHPDISTFSYDCLIVKLKMSDGQDDTLSAVEGSGKYRWHPWLLFFQSMAVNQ